MSFENFSPSVVVIIVLLLLALAALVAKRKMLKIDREAPEHRATENELYEAFGLDKHREEGVPQKEHEKKEHEVEEAFSHLKQQHHHKHAKQS